MQIQQTKDRLYDIAFDSLAFGDAFYEPTIGLCIKANISGLSYAICLADGQARGVTTLVQFLPNAIVNARYGR